MISPMQTMVAILTRLERQLLYLSPFVLALALLVGCDSGGSNLVDNSVPEPDPWYLKVYGSWEQSSRDGSALPSSTPSGYGNFGVIPITWYLRSARLEISAGQIALYETLEARADQAPSQVMGTKEESWTTTPAIPWADMTEDRVVINDGSAESILVINGNQLTWQRGVSTIDVFTKLRN